MTLADLPGAEQSAISAVIGQDQSAKLTASDGAAGDQFGFSVSISGNTVVVGSPLATVDGHSQQGRSTCSRSPLGRGT